MADFKSINAIDIFEIDGIETDKLSSTKPKMIITEHWNRRDLVVIEIEGKKHTVFASEVQRAIDNAQNTHKF